MRIKNRLLTATLYTYVQPINQKRAQEKGKKWGSFSNYINFLIAKDHGDKKSMATSEEMKKIFFTPSPNARKPKKVKAAPKGKAKRAKKARTQRSKPLTVSSKRQKFNKSLEPRKFHSGKKSKVQSTSTKRQQKKPGVIGKLLKIARKTPATNSVAA